MFNSDTAITSAQLSIGDCDLVNYIGLIALFLVIAGGLLPWWSISGEITNGEYRIMPLEFSYSPYLLWDLYQGIGSQDSSQISNPGVGGLQYLSEEATMTSNPQFQRSVALNAISGVISTKPTASTSIMVWFGSIIISLLLYVITLPILLISALKSSKKGQIIGGLLTIFTVAVFVYGLNGVGLVSGYYSETLTKSNVLMFRDALLNISWRIDTGIFLIAIGAAVSFATPYVILPSRKESLHHPESKARPIEQPEKVMESEAAGESSQKFCVNCGTRIVKAAKYCPECGGKQE